MNNVIGIKAVILDLDQTITTDTASWLQFTSLLGLDKDVHQRIFNEYKQGKLSYTDAKGELINYWKSSGNINKKEMIEIFNSIKLRQGAIEAIEYIKGRYKVCIISGAIDTFVGTIADKLGIKDHYASTRFIYDQDDELIDFDYTLSRGEEKLGFFETYCRRNNIEPNECAAIGDGESDMPIFEKVALPILFIAKETTEEQKIKIKAQIRNWKEIYTLI